MKQTSDVEKGTDEHKSLNKKIKIVIRKDMRAHNTKIIQDTIDNNKNLKTLRSKLSNGNSRLNGLSNKKGVAVSSPREISQVIEELYNELYVSTVPNVNGALYNSKLIQHMGSEDLPEIRNTLKYMKNGKSW